MYKIHIAHRQTDNGWKCSFSVNIGKIKLLAVGKNKIQAWQKVNKIDLTDEARRYN